ncbi:MAG: hypothetical protein SGJ20_11690, partial [Planctomycetota bacterium]|nr:hypothetical protein [Planctomycetota bacterium]
AGGVGGFNRDIGGFGGAGAAGGFDRGNLDGYFSHGSSIPGGFDRTADFNRAGLADGGAYARPNEGQLNNFLGMRPAAGGEVNRGDFNRVGNNDFNRNVNVNNIHPTINNRSNWANMSHDQLNNFNGKWNNAVTRDNFGNWAGNHPNQIAHWNTWGNDVRAGWRDQTHNWFNDGWWANHPHAYGWWHYQNGLNRPWGYWWTYPAWGSLASWFPWSWTEPYYYDYGTGGNVVYQDNSVYVNGQDVGTPADFAQSASLLATVAAPTNPSDADKADWMPLGVFGVSTSKQDDQPTRVMQLAVSKQGIISGTFYNTQTDQSQTIQGQVDKKTQRVAFRIGDNTNMVCETGLYNLLQKEAPMLVHFGTEKTETYLLIRIDQPKQQPGAATGGAAANDTTAAPTPNLFAPSAPPTTSAQPLNAQ